MEPATNFYFSSMEIIFTHLRFIYYEAPSLTRGRVCNLLVQLVQGLANALTLGSKSPRTPDHILLPHLRLGSRSVDSYVSQRNGGGILSRLHAAERIRQTEKL
jgi:hypothetical protein